MTTQPGQHPTMADCMKEIEKAGQAGFRIRLDFSPLNLMAIVANLQLAANHPKNTGSPAKVARELVTTIEAGFRDRGYNVIADFISAGWRREEP